MPQNENESQDSKPVSVVGRPEKPTSRVDVRFDVSGSDELASDPTDDVGAEGDTALTQDENLLATSDVQVVQRGSRLVWALAALLFLLLVASGGLNWLQHEALSAAQSGSSQMAGSLGAAQDRAVRAEADAASLRELVSDVNRDLSAVQLQISDMASRLQEASAPEAAAADQTSRSATSAE